MRVWTMAVLSGIAALSACAAVAPAAFGHGGRLPFNEWGGFTDDVLRCQRVIAQAAAQCAANAWATRRACRETTLAGRTCDEAATRANIADVRRSAQDEVDAACNELQARSLQYLGTFDLQQDFVDFCRNWELAADSAAFGPPGAGAACATATAAAVTDVMHVALRARRRGMDRIAHTAGGDPSRQALLEDAERRLARAVDTAATRLATRCPDFASRYGQPASALLLTAAARADCIGGAFYIQDLVLCAPQVCGNGVIEPNEDCDDGNTVDGDACPASCAR